MNGQLKEHGAKALDVQLREEEMQQLQEGEMEIGQVLDDVAGLASVVVVTVFGHTGVDP